MYHQFQNNVEQDANIDVDDFIYQSDTDSHEKGDKEKKDFTDAFIYLYPGDDLFQDENKENAAENFFNQDQEPQLKKQIKKENDGESVAYQYRKALDIFYKGHPRRADESKEDYKKRFIPMYPDLHKSYIKERNQKWKKKIQRNTRQFKKNTIKNLQ